MRASTIVMIGFAVVFGIIAVFVAQVWLNDQASQQARNLQPASQPAATRTIVVARQPLRFATDISAAMLKEVSWPADSVPAGAFATINDLLGGGNRVVLAAIEENEPLLSMKVTGPGQRATLSALVRPGMKAVTVRVNDVEGVGGFVLPGDHVDVVLTRQIDKGQPTSDVVLQNTRVLAVDQSADERNAKAAVARSVTLEVDTTDAQKIWLSASVGSLSLLLRKAGETAQVRTRKVTLKDLTTGEGAPERSGSATVTVTRASVRQEYSVPVEAPKLASDVADVGEKRRAKMGEATR